MSARIENLAHILAFLLAGNAHATFVSERTGTRFTYRVSTPKASDPNRGPAPHFVSVLTGPDHYEYLGCIYRRTMYAHGRKSRIGEDATSAKAFAWLWKHLSAGQMPPECEVYHEGRCGRCGRRLTTPTSVTRGLGDECASRAS